MNYYDFLGRVLIVGSHGIDYTIVEAENTGFITDLLLTAEFAEFVAQVGYAKRQSVKRIADKPKKALKKPISITLQINQ